MYDDYQQNQDTGDLDQKTFRGGSKTISGKGRIVPIQSSVFEMVKLRYNKNNEYLVTFNNKVTLISSFGMRWKLIIVYLEIDKKPHECRHTFRSLLDSAEAKVNTINLMMGHNPANVGERIYTYKTNELLPVKRTGSSS